MTSIFFGGGTPSLMQPGNGRRHPRRHRQALGRAAGAEITLEANPSSVEAGRFRGYRAAGVNRVSLGVQSLDDADLRALGRLHTVAEARAAIDVARTTFERFSFDLIYARPRQTSTRGAPSWATPWRMAGRHLSLYQLTIEPGTPFAGLHARGKLNVPDPRAGGRALRDDAGDDASGRPARLRDLQPRCAGRGKPAQPHLLALWRICRHRPGRARPPVRRTASATPRHRTPARALARQVERDGHGLVESTPLSKAEQADEVLLMGLRLTEGIDLARLAAIGGTRPDARTIRELADLGLLEMLDCDRLRATARGRFVLNALVLKLSASLARA